VSKRWVIDASPLILLQKINRVNLLSELSEELVIPKAVSNELLSYEEDRTVRSTFFRSSTKIRDLKDHVQICPDITGWGWGNGESE